LQLSQAGVYLFAGIGNFVEFKKTAEREFRNIKYIRQFPDHCRYEEKERERIRKDTEQFEPEFVITTHKDYVKLRGFDFGRPLYYLSHEVRFLTDRAAFYRQLGERLRLSHGTQV
jgi:tetraacyldisaccharide-1-P 4'-kinase